MKRSALQNKQVVILRMAFRSRKVLGTFEKRAPEEEVLGSLRDKTTARKTALENNTRAIVTIRDCPILFAFYNVGKVGYN